MEGHDLPIGVNGKPATKAALLQFIKGLNQTTVMATSQITAQHGHSIL